MVLLYFIPLLSIAVFADEVNILDYFPCDSYYTWVYSNSSGRIVERRRVSNTGPESYIFENQMTGFGTIYTIYVVLENRVVIRAIQNQVTRSHRVYEIPYPVELAPAGQEWSFNDRGDDLRLRTSNASCTVDSTVYNDCILVEERILDGNTVLRTKKSYYARGVGLVLVTLQERGGNESIYIKIVDTTIR
jgi:hypothetical protein